MKRQLNLTEDHLRLIPFVLINDDKDEVLEINKERILSLQSTLVEDVSLVLGLRDKAIKNTENDANGRAFPTDIEKYIFSVYNYVKDNLYLLETLIHQFVIKGGITPGVYECDDIDLIWHRL